MTTRHTRWFHGWEVVAGCFAMATVAWGLGFYGNGIYLAYLVGERGLPLEGVSAGITLYYWCGALLIMTCGGLVDRLGPRRSVALGAVSMTLAVCAIARAHALWHFHLAMALMAVGWLTMSSTAINAILAPWFDRKRGKALSLALTGASFGGIVLVPLITTVNRALGVRDGLTLVALACGVLVLAVAARCFVRAPALVGQSVDGDPPSRSTPAAAIGQRAHAAGDTEAPWPLRRVLMSRGFLTITGPFSVGLTIQAAMLTHQISLLQPHLGPEGAAFAVGLTALSAVIGRPVAGALMDRLPRRAVAAMNFGIQASGLVLLAASTSVAGLHAACVLVGIAVGNMITFPGLLVHQEFPASQFNRVNRLATGICQLLYACGPLLLGALTQATGTYSSPLTGFAAFSCIAALVVWFGRPSRP